jgi:hypothetical protein
MSRNISKKRKLEAKDITLRMFDWLRKNPDKGKPDMPRDIIRDLLRFTGRIQTTRYTCCLCPLFANGFYQEDYNPDICEDFHVWLDDCPSCPLQKRGHNCTRLNSFFVLWDESDPIFNSKERSKGAEGIYNIINEWEIK